MLMDTRLMLTGRNSLSTADSFASDLPQESIKLEYCWVCDETFTEFGGRPSFFKHDHHLVPRAYGGVDGPTVSLCDSHHTTLHQMALRMYSNKPHFDLLTRNPVYDRKLLWLASLVVNARHLTENDPNKPLVLHVVADKNFKSKLKALKTVFPKSSYTVLIRYAVEQLYRKHFQD